MECFLWVVWLAVCISFFFSTVRHQTFAGIFQAFGGGSQGRPVCWSLCYVKESPRLFCSLCSRSLKQTSESCSDFAVFRLFFRRHLNRSNINVRDLSSVFRGDTWIFQNRLTDQVGKQQQKDSSTSVDRSLNCLWVSKPFFLIHGLSAGWETAPQCGESLQVEPSNVVEL